MHGFAKIERYVGESQINGFAEIENIQGKFGNRNIQIQRNMQ
jgi:hypothetical protein